MNSIDVDVLVISPFRRATFRTAISESYPVEEPFDSPPVVAASELQNAGFAVGLLALQNVFRGFDADAQADRDSLVRALRHFRPKLAIFSTDHLIPSRSTATAFGARVTAEVLKQISPDTTVGMMGRLATTAWRDVLRAIPEIDFALLGEADLVLPEAAAYFLRSSHAPLPEAVVTREDLVTEGRRHVPASIDEPDLLAAPDYNLLNTSIDMFRNRVRVDGPIPISLRTTYGCKFQCKFCAGVPNWRNYRKKSASRVGLELDRLSAALGDAARVAFLEDEIFTRDLNHVHAVADEFEARGTRVAGVYTHSTLMSADVAKHLARMCRRVYFGLDNADDGILRGMGKGQRLGGIFDAIKIAKAAGLQTHLEWIVGSPPESSDSLATTICAIFSLLSTNVVDSANTYVYCPHPGTEYAENSESFGLRVLAGFEDIQESGGYPACDTEFLTRNQVFVAYLMSQVVIAEATAHRNSGVTLSTVRPPNRTELLRLFERVGAPDEQRQR